MCPQETVIYMEVAGAQKPLIRHGIFRGKNRICDVKDDVPPQFFEQYVMVRFHSGLMLSCLGSQVATLRRGRQ